MYMRYCLLFLLCCSTFVYASVDVRNGKVSASLSSEPLDSVLESLRQQTQVKFSIQEGIGGQQISANFENLPLAAAIKKMLEGTGINFVILGNKEGEPESVFIGVSERPGAPPRRIDNRPPQNRGGVVTPVAPLPPEMPRRPEVSPVPVQKREPPTEVDVPTGGGYMPQSVKSPPENAPPDQEFPPEEEESPEE